MSKSDNAENSILALIFNATSWTGIAINHGTPATTLTVALHTADPGEAGTQSTSEVSYTGYARVAVARTSGGWTVTANSVSPVATISFGQRSDVGSATITHFSVGTGTGNVMLYSGTVTPNIVVSQGVTPQLSTSSTITED